MRPQNIRSLVLLIVLIIGLVVIGCGGSSSAYLGDGGDAGPQADMVISDTASSDTTSPDATESDALSPEPDTLSPEPDTLSPEPDTSMTDTHQEDTGSEQDTAQPEPDTHEPDTATPCGDLGQDCCPNEQCNGSLICSAGSCVEDGGGCPNTPACIVPSPGEPDVPITMASGSPPTLGGGTITNGEFELTEIKLYTDNTFSAMVMSVDLHSNGNTYGSAEIVGADWGFSANLDMYIGLDVLFVGLIEQPTTQQLYAGGCYTVSGNQLISDITICGAGWPEGVAPPDSLEYEFDENGIRLLIILTQEAIVAMIPPEYQSYAGMAIVGDLPILMTFEPR